MSPWLVALAVIVGGGFALRRLRLLPMARRSGSSSPLVAVAAAGDCLTAGWHRGPVWDRDFWSILALSPEILIFVFYMITDPQTAPAGPTGGVYAAATGWSPAR